MSENNILIFEDQESNYEELRDPLLEHEKAGRFAINQFPPEKTAPDNWTSDERPEATDILTEELTDPIPDLVVLDWELSGFKSDVRREHVQAACKERGIPLCVYHRNEGHFADPQELKEYEEDLIPIDVKEAAVDVADAVLTIADAFVEIKGAIKANAVSRMEDALYESMNVPTSAETQMEQYSMGQSTTLRVAKEDLDEAERTRIISTFIGYWIHNQLLEYPGVLLNRTATASYLGVDPNDFAESTDCQDALIDARYGGPFSDLSRDDWWWTNRLDDFRLDLPPNDDGDLLSGPSLFRELCDVELAPVRCVEGGEERGGYYCVLTEEPVCKEHSEQPQGWIPVGATRSRISDSKYEEVTSWMPGN
jgi:hypothetical protein